MDHILELIREHGEWFYLITFIWTALEGETFVIFAAWAAQAGFLEIHWLFLAAMTGTIFGDQCYFYLGRRYGIKFLEKYPKKKAKVDKVLGWIEKYSTAFILSYRFIYGVRNISGFALGMSNVSWRKFTFLNIIAACIWATAFCAAGYYLGGAIQNFFENNPEKFDHAMYTIAATIVVAFGVFYLIKKLRERFAAKKAALNADV